MKASINKNVWVPVEGHGVHAGQHSAAKYGKVMNRIVKTEREPYYQEFLTQTYVNVTRNMVGSREGLDEELPHDDILRKRYRNHVYSRPLDRMFTPNPLTSVVERYRKLSIPPDVVRIGMAKPDLGRPITLLLIENNVPVRDQKQPVALGIEKPRCVVQ